MKLLGSQNQTGEHPLYVADITCTGSAQLVLGISQSRQFLILQNLGTHSMFIEFGSARGKATLSGATVGSVAVTNAGFGFTKPPVVRFFGGGQPPAYSTDLKHVQSGVNSSYTGNTQPGAPTPNHTAVAHATLSGGAVNAIVVDDPGAGYIIAPYVQLFNSDLEPIGAAIPSATSGLTMASGAAPIRFDASFCPTESISVLGTNGDVLLCRWSD